MSARSVVEPVDVALRDGSTLRMRPVRAGDLEGLRALLAGMSEDSRWLRFLSAAVSLDRAAQHAADPSGGVGLVATAGTPEQIVAHAEYVRETRDRAEVAFEVADTWHGRGIATILLAHLASAAERDGIETFVAYVHPSNHRMVGVFRESGFPVNVTSDAGELVVELPAAVGPEARARFEDRSRAAAVAAVAHVVRPASVAVIGGTAAARTVARNIEAGGYTGTLAIVESGRPVTAGTELAILAVPTADVVEAGRECAAAGVRSVAVLAEGFADAGADGRARLADLLAICRSTGMRMVGPNCLGIVNTDPEIGLNAVATEILPARGRVALASQSTAISIAAIAEARRRGLGLSTFVATGDKADLSGNDFLQFWEQDPVTDIVLLYLESFGNPRRFAQIARRTGTVKPIVAVKTGRRASPPGPDATTTRRLLSASDVTVDALFAHAGVIRTETIAEQLDVAALLAAQPLPAGNRVAIVTNGRGPALACAEACVAGGLRVDPPTPLLRRALSDRLPQAADPGNPVDLRAHTTADDYAAAIDLLARDDAVDAIVAIFAPPLGTDALDIAAALRRAAAGTAAEGVPLVGVFPAHGEAELRALAGGREVPLYGAPVVAARALARIVAYTRWQGRQADAAAPPPAGLDADAAAGLIAEALSRGEGWLQPAEVQALLGAYGVPLAEARFAATPLEAGRCAVELGGPVALKVTAPDLIYKSEAGGVRLGLRGAAQTEQAAEEAASAVRNAGHEPEAFVVQRMAPAGVEMAAGVLTDPDFGPFVACGAAGRAVELLGDVTVRLAPVGPSEAADMIGELRTFPLLDGYRGAPRMDRAALADVLERLSRMAATHAELIELDCDPVLVSPAGAVVLDARAKVRSRSVARPFPALDR